MAVKKETASAVNADKKKALDTAMAQIEKMYGKGFFYEDAINEVLPDAFDAALAESGLAIVGQPEFDIVSIDDNGVVISGAKQSGSNVLRVYGTMFIGNSVEQRIYTMSDSTTLQDAIGVNDSLDGGALIVYAE